MKKEKAHRFAYILRECFAEIHHPFWEQPALSSDQIRECFSNFVKSRGRYEWEYEAIVKTLIQCSCPVYFDQGSGIPQPNLGARQLCEKCEPYFGSKT